MAKRTASYWGHRFVQTLLYTIVAFILLTVMLYLITCGLIGPWGAAIDTVADSDLPWVSRVLSYVVPFATPVGALVIGWHRGKRSAERSAHEPPIDSATVDRRDIAGRS